MALYENSEFLLPERSIRVVRGRPSREPAFVVDLEMRVVGLDDKDNDYIALSYMWGDPEPTVPIHVNGVVVNVRQNLYDFLQEMEAQHVGAWFWIDALCINQDLVDEKTSQAESVLIWLGTWERDPNLLLGLLDKVKQTVDYWDRNGEVPVDGLKYTEEERRAFEDFCNRLYWRRTWTIQERVLASSVSIACGPMRIDWRHMDRLGRYHALDIISSSGTGYIVQQIFKTSPAIEAQWDRRALDSRGTEQMRLEHLIFQHRKRQATDPRDKIFALLALATPPAPILADYSKTPIELYREVLELKYPQGAQTIGIDPEIVAGILPIILELDRSEDEYKAVIREYFPQGWSST